MNRRLFVSSLGITTVGIFSISSLTFGSGLKEQAKEIPLEELKLSLENYCNKVFNSTLELERLNPNGRYSFAEAFEVRTNTDKNSVFDFSDRIIELAKSIGFDASELKKEIIPKGISIFNGGVMISNEGKISVFKIPELLNYNASVIFKNCINILAKVPPCEWTKLDELEKSDNGKTYTGNLKGPFKIWKIGEQSMNFNIEEIKPVIKLGKNDEQIQRINLRNLRMLLPEKIIQTINL